jgi:hypothetical protein
MAAISDSKLPAGAIISISEGLNIMLQNFAAKIGNLIGQMHWKLFKIIYLIYCPARDIICVKLKYRIITP